MTIVVTGATGNVGRPLVTELIAAGARVRAVTRQPAQAGFPSEVEVFGSGGGARVAKALTTRLGYSVPMLARVPLDPAVREAGDEGVPIVGSTPQAPAAQALTALASHLAARGRGLVGRQLGLAPVGR